MGEIIKEYGGWVVAFLGILGTFWYNSRKVQVDESAVVLAKWKELAETHQADMRSLKAEMQADRDRYQADRARYEADRARHEEELSAVRRRLKEVEAEFLQFRKEAEAEIRERNLQITGLKRTLSQISQSTAVQIGRVKGGVEESPAGAAIVEQIAKLDQAGHNSLEGEGE